MNTPADSQLEASCPYCRATIRIPADPGTEEVRCKKCAEKIPLILLNLRASSSPQMVSEAHTADPTGASVEAAPPQRPEPKPPATEVRVICKLCGTIVYAPVADVGKEVQCPDCESMNVIPPPPKPPKKVDVRVDDDDSVRLTEGIDQPDAESASMKQKWYMVTCPTCFTQFRMTVDQAGSQIDCPDCLTTFTAADPPPEPKQRPTVVLDDTYDLKLSDPVDRPPVDVDDLIGSKQVPRGSELKAASTSGDLDSRDKLKSLYSLVKGEKPEGEPAKEPPEPDMPIPDIRGAKPATSDEAAGEEEVPPAQPPAQEGKPSAEEGDPDSRLEDSSNDTITTGDADTTEDDAADAKPKRRFRLSAQSIFFRKLLTTGLTETLSDRMVLGLAIVIAISVAATLYLGALTIDEMNKPMQSAMQQFMLLCMSALFALTILLSVVVAANTMLPIVISTSLEQNEIENWPAFSVGDWLLQSMYLINAFAIGALPTALFAPFLSLPMIVILQLITIVPVFPIAVLSMLDEGSPFAPYAPGLWSLLPVHKGLWWRFTLVGYVFGTVGAIVGGLVIYTNSFLLAILAGLVISALLIIYARFLGRMAMFMSDQSIIQESLEEYDD